MTAVFRNSTLTERRYSKPTDRLDPHTTRCRSIHHAHNGNSQPRSPVNANAFTLGGGGPNAAPRYSATNNAMKSQSAIDPTRSRGFVIVAYNHTPAANITPSTTSVIATEFHIPNPTSIALPGYNGKSRPCTTTSSTQ